MKHSRLPRCCCCGSRLLSKTGVIPCHGAIRSTLRPLPFILTSAISIKYEGLLTLDVGQVDENSAVLENLIHYAVNLMSTLVVDPLDKLTTSWGHVKTLY